MFLGDRAVVAKRGRQPNWEPPTACRETKAELKALKEAQKTWKATSDAHIAWALRDRLRGFLDAYEEAKRERAVVDFQDLVHVVDRFPILGVDADIRRSDLFDIVIAATPSLE